MSNKQITIVINTFNSEDKIHKCIGSVPNEYKVIVIENSKNENFKKELEQKYSNVQCFLAGKNLGYAKGNNLGLSKVKSEYALILNPDAFLEKNTLNNFFRAAEKVQNFSILGPAKQNEFIEEDQNTDKEDIFEVDHLKGFAIFLNLHQFKDIGFFDENFFIYLEEIDLCKRLKNKDKKIYLDKKIVIHHLGGSSHNKTLNFEMELSRNWHWMWSTFYFNRKHYGFMYSLLKVSGKLFSSSLKTLFYIIIFENEKKKIHYQRLSGLLNSIIGKKSWYRPNIITH
jgi:GT2 family glycosyltransferase